MTFLHVCTSYEYYYHTYCMIDNSYRTVGRHQSVDVDITSDIRHSGIPTQAFSNGTLLWDLWVWLTGFMIEVEVEAEYPILVVNNKSHKF
jgi:hypothetical protein